MALMELEEPDGVKRMVDGPPKAIDKLASTDRSLLEVRRGLDKPWVQLGKPVSIDRHEAPEDLLVVVEVETPDHPLNGAVVCVRVPATADCLAVDDS